MTVNVCGHLYVRVPHVFLHIFQGKSTVQKQTCTTVPKLMETDVRQVIVFQQQGKMRGYVIRGKGLAVRPFENKIVFFIQSKMSAKKKLGHFGGIVFQVFMYVLLTHSSASSSFFVILSAR